MVAFLGHDFFSRTSKDIASIHEFADVDSFEHGAVCVIGVAGAAGGV